MKCPYCSKIENKVIDSRLSKDGRTIRRRRECTECGRRFTTYEKLEEILPLVQELGKKEIDSKEIGEMVISNLKEWDDVAYVRFASVYRQFRDISEFMAELEEILKSRKEKERT